MFGDINEVTPYPETGKVSELEVDHPYRVKGGNLIKTKFGMKIVLELKGDDGKEFIIYIPKALNDVMLKNSNHWLDIFNKGGTLVTHVGNTKFEAGVTKKPAPVKRNKRKIAKIIEIMMRKKKTPPKKISKKIAKNKFIDLEAKEADKDESEVEKDDSRSDLELSD
ncbi:hypothetical protein QAD02_016091 [Eretmocerus hayati]|uniref:Uncharacterized protein n=1 Tax=Eretmocerus hayati TaxID=131215 RepID=A0ACC2P9K7_9HYME|nr:hypothetical protein QAD02_016091 [Eretmocerus hayati]